MDRPIIFSAPMVRALFDGRKTQTRRITAQPPPECGINYMLGNESWLPPEQRSLRRRSFEAWGGPLFDAKPKKAMCGSFQIVPRWQIGDQLWVRENWRTSVQEDKRRPITMEVPGGGYGWPVWYEADGGAVTWRGSMNGGPGFVNPGKLRPCIHMPRWASRLTLLVTAVKVERLQDISEADILAEGIDPLDSELASSFSRFESIEGGGRSVEAQEARTRRPAFRRLWDAIHGEGAWQRNEWVAAISFDVIRGNIDTPAPQRPNPDQEIGR